MPSLFTLSRELRDQIYDIALNDCEIEPPATPADVDRETRRCKTNGIIYDSTPVRPSSAWSSSILPTDNMVKLLCVCRTMHAEIQDRIARRNSPKGVRKTIFMLDCCTSFNYHDQLEQLRPSRAVEILSWWTWTKMSSFATAVDILRVTVSVFKPAELSLKSAYRHKWALFHTCWDAERAAKDAATMFRDLAGNCHTFERVEFYFPPSGTAEEEKAVPAMGKTWVPFRMADRKDYANWIKAMADAFVAEGEALHSLGAARYPVKEHAWFMGKELIVELHGNQSIFDGFVER